MAKHRMRPEYLGAPFHDSTNAIFCCFTYELQATPRLASLMGFPRSLLT